MCKAKLTEIFQVDERLGWDNVCGSDSQEINIWDQFRTPLPKCLITVADNRHGIRTVSGKCTSRNRNIRAKLARVHKSITLPFQVQEAVFGGG